LFTKIFSLKLESTPGSKVKYSSPGYFVLASILENLYGKSYGALVKEKINDPLKLSHVGQLDHSTVVSGLVAGYVQGSDGLVMAPYRSYSLMKGSGDLYASAQDLIAFLDSFTTPLWPASLSKEMFSPHTVEAVERGDRYGYGWFIREKTDRPKAFYHGGGSYGVSTLMARYPEEKLSIVILSNVSVMPVNQIWSDIEDMVLGKPFELPIVRTSMQISAATLAALVGNYIASNQMELTIFAEAGKLYAKMAGRPPFEIFQQQLGKFYGKKVAIDLIFSIDNSGKATGINVTGMGQQFDFKRK
jgi:CubicO group peptidase (beta-lactamase class C family)